MPAEVRGGVVSASEVEAVAGAVAGSTEETAPVREAAGRSAAASSDVAVGAADVAVFGLYVFRIFVKIYVFRH